MFVLGCSLRRCFCHFKQLMLKMPAGKRLAAKLGVKLAQTRFKWEGLTMLGVGGGESNYRWPRRRTGM